MRSLPETVLLLTTSFTGMVCGVLAAPVDVMVIVPL
jgi:hypothetical protein